MKSSSWTRNNDSSVAEEAAVCHKEKLVAEVKAWEADGTLGVEEVEAESVPWKGNRYSQGSTLRTAWLPGAGRPSCRATNLHGEVARTGNLIL